jgi:hypothetical protein
LIDGVKGWLELIPGGRGKKKSTKKKGADEYRSRRLMGLMWQQTSVCSEMLAKALGPVH